MRLVRCASYYHWKKRENKYMVMLVSRYIYIMKSAANNFVINVFMTWQASDAKYWSEKLIVIIIEHLNSAHILHIQSYKEFHSLTTVRNHAKSLRWKNLFVSFSCNYASMEAVNDAKQWFVVLLVFSTSLASLPETVRCTISFQRKVLNSVTETSFQMWLRRLHSTHDKTFPVRL